MKKLSFISSNISNPKCVPSQETKFQELVKNLSSGSFLEMSNTSLNEKHKRYSSPLPLMDETKIQALNEADLLMELIKDTSNELDINILCHKILRNVSLLTNSDRGSLFLTKGTKEAPILVSHLYDVTINSTLKESLHSNENAIVIPWGVGIAGHVAGTKEAINIKNAYEDNRFNPEVDKKTGYRTYAILCMPIMNYEGEVVGVAQIINKRAGPQEFTAKDQEVFRKYLIFCGIGIQNARLFQISIQEYKRNRLLLQLARNIFEQQNTLDQLVPKIMRDTQEIIKADSAIYIIHKDCTLMSPADLARSTEIPPPNPSKGPIEFSPVFRLCHNKTGEYEIKKLKAEEFQDLPETQIATYVVTNGETLNIHDGKANSSQFELHKSKDNNEPLAPDDPLLHQNILTVPIMNNENIVFGAVQFIQNRGENPFEDGDISLIQAFALFCGLGINNTSMYENVVKLIAKQNVALEVLSYHATASKEEAHKIRAMNIPSVSKLRLNAFEFDDKDMSDDQTILASLAMLYHLNIPSIFNIPIEVLTRWLLSVRKNYRDVTYHNWRHAFNVAQVMFCLITTGGLSRLFTNVEILAFMVACLCHDLDHRGTNNAFMSKAGTSLAKVYGTSTLEHHHFDQCIMILTSPGNTILQALSPSEYKHCIELLESYILATDLAIYFKKRSKFIDLVRKGETDFSSPEEHLLLSSMMMTACDIAAITKPWAVQKRIGILVAKEFFEQGDIEKEELHLKPLPLMDRDKASEMPKMQVDFINVVCLPLYEALAKYDTKLDPMLQGVLSNRQNWQQLADNPDFDINDFQPKKDKDSDSEGSRKNHDDINSTGALSSDSASFVEASTQQQPSNSEAKEREPKTSTSRSVKKSHFSTEPPIVHESEPIEPIERSQELTSQTNVNRDTSDSSGISDDDKKPPIIKLLKPKNSLDLYHSHNLGGAGEPRSPGKTMKAEENAVGENDTKEKAPPKTTFRHASRAKIEPLENLADEENERVIQQCMESPKADAGDRVSRNGMSPSSAEKSKLATSTKPLIETPKHNLDIENGLEKSLPLSSSTHKPTNPQSAEQIFSPTHQEVFTFAGENQNKNGANEARNSLTPPMRKLSQQPSTSKTDINFYEPDGKPDAEMIDDYTFPEPPPKKPQSPQKNGGIELTENERKGLGSKVHFESLVYKPRNPVPTPLQKLKKKAGQSSKVCIIL